MNTYAILPTVTQRVRTFLADQGAALRPWTGLQETYDEFYSLLRRRRNDPEFWQPLKGLLEDIIQSAVDPDRPRRLTTEQAELLASWKVDKLIDELRDALPSEATDVALAPADFTRKLSTAVLGGFLLIGLAAAGCSSDLTPTGVGGAGGDAAGAGGQVVGQGGMPHSDAAVDAARRGGMATAGMGGVAGAAGVGVGGGSSGGAGGGAGASAIGGADAGRDGMSGADAGPDGIGGGDASNVDGGTSDTGTSDAVADSADGADGADGVDAADGPDGSDVPDAGYCTSRVASALDRTIGDSSLKDSEKARLCSCFAALTTGWTTSLTELFATATPQQISKALGVLLSCCQSTGIRTQHGVNAGPSSSDLGYIKDGSGMLCAAPSYKGVSFPD